MLGVVDWSLKPQVISLHADLDYHIHCQGKQEPHVPSLIEDWFMIDAQVVRKCVKPLPPHRLLVTTAYKKHEGRVLGGQFLDGISNALDAISLKRQLYNIITN